MEIGTICIRNARISDIEDIYWVLHSESIAWGVNKIETNLNHLYILTYKEKLLCVAYGSFMTAKPEIYWTAVHPLFPKSALSSAVCNLIFSLQRKAPITAPIYNDDSALKGIKDCLFFSSLENGAGDST